MAVTPCRQWAYGAQSNAIWTRAQERAEVGTQDSFQPLKRTQPATEESIVSRSGTQDI